MHYGDKVKGSRKYKSLQSIFAMCYELINCSSCSCSSHLIQLSSSDSGHSRSSSWESGRVGFACQLPVGMWEALFGLPTCHRKVRTYGSPWGGWFVYGVLHLRICRLNKLGLILPSILMNSPQAFDASWMRKFWFLCFNLCSTREES